VRSISGDHGADDQGERDDPGIAGVAEHGDSALDGGGQCGQRVAVAQQPPAQPDARQQRQNHLTADDGEDDGADRRKDGQPAGIGHESVSTEAVSNVTENVPRSGSLPPRMSTLSRIGARRLAVLVSRRSIHAATTSPDGRT
jgi:hypothetical protein